MKALGVEKLIITNACGAVNTEFNPGDLMVITDHINLTANNPLMGPNNPELGVRFLDVSEVYNKELRQTIFDVAKEQGVSLRQGVYAWWRVNLWTPAEIRMIRTLGADAVGMSTVPEALVAHHFRLKRWVFLPDKHGMRHFRTTTEPWRSDWDRWKSEGDLLKISDWCHRALLTSSYLISN
nr:purine-nucleoside phosphorylase [Providencia alcalifaciens]